MNPATSRRWAVIFSLTQGNRKHQTKISFRNIYRTKQEMQTNFHFTKLLFCFVLLPPLQPDYVIVQNRA